MADVDVVIFDNSVAITQQGFGVPLIMDTTLDVPYTEVTKTEEIPSQLKDLLSGKMVAACLGQTPAPTKVAVVGFKIDLGNAVSITSSLNSLVDQHNDWYFFLLADRKPESIQEAATWINANGKVFITSNRPFDPSDSSYFDVSAIKTLVQNISSDRCAFFAHDGGTGVDQCLDAAIVGRMAAVDPGTATWKFKRLNGVSVTTYTTTQLGDLASANVNTYVNSMGDIVTSDGKTTKGSYIDIQIAKDWLKARITENLTQLLHSQDKISYDDTGIALVVGRLKENLRNAVAEKVIATDVDGNGLWSITVPNRENIPTNARASRVLTDIYWEATIAGAIHNVSVTGVLKV